MKLQKDYDSNNAHTLIKLANFSYYSRAQIKKKFQKEFDFNKYHFISRKGSQCIIASNIKCIVIAFRGTQINKIEDILTDIEIEPIKRLGGKIHRGFYKAYRNIRSPLLKKIGLHGKGKPVFLTGHSLGGSLATLAAVDLHDKGFDISSVYTAGQPRVGDSQFAKAYQTKISSTFRFSNIDDIIPSIPPKKVPALNYSYQHVGNKIYVVDNQTITTKYEKSNNIFNRFESAGSSLSAHGCDGYEKSLENNIGFNPITDSKTIKEKPILTGKDIEKGLESGWKESKQAGKNAVNEVGNFAKDSGKKISKAAKKWFK